MTTYCHTHNIPALQYNNNIVLQSPMNQTTLYKIKQALNPTVLKYRNTLQSLDKLYEGPGIKAIKYVMELYRNMDSPSVIHRAQVKLNELVKSVNLDSNQFHNSTLIDFGAAPGMFMQSYIDNDNTFSNLIIAVTIQSAMMYNLAKDSKYYRDFVIEQSKLQESYIHKNELGLPLTGLLAPELYSTSFPSYDGNIYCSLCIDSIMKYITSNIKELPSIKLLVSDIGSAIQYTKNHRRVDSNIDNFYLPFILLDIADTIEHSADTHYNHRIIIICKMQNFSYQLCFDNFAYDRLGALMNKCYDTDRHLIITKPHGSRKSNNEMYAIIIPESELSKTNWKRHTLLKPDNMWYLVYELQQMQCITQQLVENAWDMMRPKKKVKRINKMKMNTD